MSATCISAGSGKSGCIRSIVLLFGGMGDVPRGLPSGRFPRVCTSCARICARRALQRLGSGA
eukprot:12806088-Alexandrium_andersonii.AAC.1